MSHDTGRRPQRSNFYKTRGYSGAFMGLLYCCLALFFAFYKLEETTAFIGGQKWLGIALLALMFAYGIFRIYRGIKMTRGAE